jgi:meso-butanediol dehydrogenase/(S,S)-butanediol dehydrogenase/diacetyl reductase
MHTDAEEGHRLVALDLAGRVAVVTGGAKGIGRGIVEVLARHGADIVVADLEVEEAQRAAEEVHRKGSRVTAASVDVTDWTATHALVRDVIEEFGHLDILVNNAGVSRSIPFVDLDETEWDRVFDINVKGVFIACHAVLPHMIERRHGKIINLSSRRPSRCSCTTRHRSSR